MVRRFALLFLSGSLLLGLTGGGLVFAQEAKKDEPKKADEPKAAAPAATPESKKADEPKAAAPTATPVAEPKKEEPLPPIPPAVEAKLAAARKAVAEAIVAAQDAGLVKSSIDPPPILDILIDGRATDESAVKARTGVSPEVFGAWFTGFGTTKDVNVSLDVRILHPSAGLKAWYERRAAFLRREIEAVRKANGSAVLPTPTPTPTPAATPKAEEKKAEPKKEEMKKEEPKKEEVKKEEPKAEPKKEEPKAEEVKKEEPKKEAPKAEEVKKEEPKKEEPKAEEVKKDAPKQ